VNYKQYLIETFEQKPMRWRARIKRLDGRNIRVHVPQMEYASIVAVETRRQQKPLLVSPRG
jgi:hypothetical protein